MSAGESNKTYSAEDVKAEVRQTIGQLSEMSRSDISFDEFCQNVLTRVVKLTGGHASLLWQSVTNGPPRITHKVARPGLDLQTEDAPRGELIAQVIEQKKPLAIPSSRLEEIQSPLEEEAEFLLLAAPVFNRTKNCVGALELMQRCEISDSAKDGYIKFLMRIADLFPRWHEHHELKRLSENAESMSSTLDFVTEIHKSIDVDETSFAIANEARRVLAADRVSVAKWNGSNCKVVSVSSQDRFDNRANVIRMLGDVATASVKIETPFWITGSTEGLAPKVAKMINDYMDESHCRTLAVIPLIYKPPVDPEAQFKPSLREKPRKLGALIVEFFDADILQEQIAEPCKLVTEHAELAMANASRHSDIWLLPVWTRLGRAQKFLFRDHYTKTMTGIVALTIFLLVLMFFPKELQMRVSGVMQPTERRNLFAQTEGIIRTVTKDHGEHVEAGELLIELENQELDMEISQEQLQLAEIEEEIKTTRRVVAMQEDLPIDKSLELAQKLDLLEAQRTNKHQILELLSEKKAQQKLYSPITGTVVQWDAKKRLQDLPVQANQYVMEIADLSGEWQIELEVPQAKVGYINAEFREMNGQPLDAEFRVATNPNVPLRGKLVRVADRAELSATTGTPYFRAVIEADVSQLKDLRPGAGVTARIDCGKRSLGFVWFHQIIDFFRTQVFF